MKRVFLNKFLAYKIINQKTIPEYATKTQYEELITCKKV